MQQEIFDTKEWENTDHEANEVWRVFEPMDLKASTLNKSMPS